MASLAQSPTISNTTGDFTVNVPSGLSGVTIVYVGIINDGDGAHTGIDGSFTFGGNTMTDALGGQLNNGNYHLSIYILKNFTGNGNQTMHIGNHGGFGTIVQSVYIVQNSDTTTEPDAFTTGNTTAANPAESVTTTVANDFLIEGLGCGNTATVNNSQTADNTGSGSNAYTASKAATSAASYTMGWVMSSSNYVHGIVAIKGIASAAAIPNKIFQIKQAVNRASTY